MCGLEATRTCVLGVVGGIGYGGLAGCSAVGLTLRDGLESSLRLMVAGVDDAECTPPTERLFCTRGAFADGSNDVRGYGATGAVAVEWTNL